MRRALLVLLVTWAGCDCGPREPPVPDAEPPCHSYEVECLGACCTLDQQCLEGVCCPAPMICGNVCCPSSRLCLQGVCDECPAPLCGSQCCPLETQCRQGACCPDERVCLDECCPIGTLCEADRCVEDCGHKVRCGEIGDPTCCEGEDVCHFGQCTTPGPPCRDDEGCDPSEICDPARQRCLPRGDGGPVDAGLDAPPDGSDDGAVAQ